MTTAARILLASLLFREQPFIEGKYAGQVNSVAIESLLFREQPFIEGRTGTPRHTICRSSLLFREQPFIEGALWRSLDTIKDISRCSFGSSLSLRERRKILKERSFEVAALSGAAFH